MMPNWIAAGRIDMATAAQQTKASPIANALEVSSQPIPGVWATW